MSHLLALMLSLLLGQVVDTISVPAVITSEKQVVPVGKMASPVSTLSRQSLEKEGIQRPGSLTARIPNLYLPDYGASLTASIYHRGFGARIDNPVLGLYLDGIPILDKNAYDFEYLDIAQIRLLRGSQGTLYGRNAMSGVMQVRSLSPSRFQGRRTALEYGSAVNAMLRFSSYWKQNGLSVGLRHGNGFFTNEHTGKKIDPHNGLFFRHKFEKRCKGGALFENTVSLSALQEGGFAYSRLEDGQVLPASFDGENSYRRFQLTEGATLRKTTDRWHQQTAASIQLLADRMRMDQDFTPEPVFTLEQRQRIGGATLETVFQPVSHPDWWNASTGVFVFYKFNRMSAPVHFLERGTTRLILDNANRNIPASVGWLDFDEHEFPIFSEFSIQTWNSAVFHESVFSTGRWLFTVGLRLDYEGGTMAYDSHASVHYRFHPVMKQSKEYETRYRGREWQHNLQILPKMSAVYEAVNGENFSLRFFSSLAKGHKAGGFNTQIFSDILQGMMMNGLMDDLGVHLDKEIVSPGSENTRYRPEVAWTWETGTRFSILQILSGTVNFFAIDCRNQQLTVFPPGQSTGRMMTNAGRSKSLGFEAEAALESGGWDLRGAYGYNRARFVEYNDGNEDYSGKTLPYAPSSTLSVSASYRFKLGGKSFRWLEAGTHVQRIGKICWNDANTRTQDPYLTLGAHLTLGLSRVELYLRGENLTNTRYHTFYFKSVGNEFFQLAKPRRLTLGILFNFQ